MKFVEFKNLRYKGAVISHCRHSNPFISIFILCIIFTTHEGNGTIILNNLFQYPLHTLNTKRLNWSDWMTPKAKVKRRGFQRIEKYREKDVIRCFYIPSFCRTLKRCSDLKQTLYPNTLGSLCHFNTLCD
ncbi:hypothetical protein BEWA_012970 [Theileria equi strain WA]|uniref:Uncharacterized protein n=1 Tax=Theileria equi strain WA TaxID=1537102 RepID=L1LC46_THEEQ|nr:hypothetical protein BEWA_012970 [Theileria equi strain WA]EKX72738.1 hypothetical protein BEWA_012970 [Theileria equi strain WA]|eukprot:XP_004832190.1 hypothetical protein BEWA_012970 [Theileria equi strain WA]